MSYKLSASLSDVFRFGHLRNLRIILSSRLPAEGGYLLSQPHHDCLGIVNTARPRAGEEGFGRGHRAKPDVQPVDARERLATGPRLEGTGDVGGEDGDFEFLGQNSHPL